MMNRRLPLKLKEVSIRILIWGNKLKTCCPAFRMLPYANAGTNLNNGTSPAADRTTPTPKRLYPNITGESPSTGGKIRHPVQKWETFRKARWRPHRSERQLLHQRNPHDVCGPDVGKLCPNVQCYRLRTVGKKRGHSAGENQHGPVRNGFGHGGFHFRSHEELLGCGGRRR